MPPHRLLFLALHLVNERLSSGGDVLFGNLARQLALDPEWEVTALAPAYCAPDLERYGMKVVPVSAPADEPQRLALAPARIPFTWQRRQREGIEAAQAYHPDIVYATGDFFPNVVVGSWLKQHYRTPFASVVHHINEHPFARRNELARSVLSFGMQRFSLRTLRRRADAVFLLNSDVRGALASFGFQGERLHTVGAAIDVQRFPFVENRPSQNNVLWLHRLEPTKGMMDIGPILQQLPDDVTIDIVGSGPASWRERLERDLQTRGISARARFHGYVDEEQLTSLFQNAAVFISCSYEEGWGISMSEALACGIPCVAYELPSNSEVFGETITTVPIGDTKAFADAVKSALAAPETTVSRAMRRSFVERYSYPMLATKEKAILRSLLRA